MSAFIPDMIGGELRAGTRKWTPRQTGGLVLWLTHVPTQKKARRIEATDLQGDAHA